MDAVRIRLDLSRHCVETAIRKRYNRLLTRALKSPGSIAALEQELELLKSALEGFDFGRLRSRFHELAGHRPDLIELEAAAGGSPRLRINGKPVEAP